MVKQPCTNRIPTTSSDDTTIMDEFKRAYENNDAEAIGRLLADPRVNPTADDNHAIRRASESGYTDVVKRLLADRRVNPTDRNNYAIRMAAENGHVDVVKLLLVDPRRSIS